MEKRYLLTESLVACAILYWIEQVLAVDYLTKTIAKIILFAVIPIIYIRLARKIPGKDGLNLRRFEPSALRLGLLLGALAFAVVIAAYFVLGQYVDFNAIASELQAKSKINPTNFILVGLYITLGNSFLEEFFFRGFIFLTLYHQGSRKLATIYSSVLFGMYHIAIFKTWFNPLLIGIALLGLVSVGIIFNWLDTKTDNFINSWIVHILADSAIIVVGLRMFRMI